MTFAEFAKSVRDNIFPDGPAENLITWYRTFTERALIDLQIKVPSLRKRHVDHVPHDATRFSCWASVIDRPDGKITRVSVLSGGDCCKEIPLHYVLPHHFRRMKTDLSRYIGNPTVESTYEMKLPVCGGGNDWKENNGGYGTESPFTPDNVITTPTTTDVTFSTLEGCLKVAGSAQDRKSDTLKGFFTVDEGMIEMLPRLRSTETAVVRWQGSKKSWGDSDIVDFSSNVQAAVEDYVNAQSLSRLDRMVNDAAVAQASYNNAVATILFEFREKEIIHEDEHSMSEIYD